MRQRQLAWLMALCGWLAMATIAAGEAAPLDWQEFAYTGQSLDIAPQTRGNTRENVWRPDGTMLFVVGRASQRVVAYRTPEPWDLDEAEPLAVFDFSRVLAGGAGSNAHGLYFAADGEQMWLFNRSEIWAFTLTEAWDIATAEPTGHAPLRQLVPGLHGHGIAFKPDGSKLYVDDRIAGAIFAFALEEPWDVASAELKATLDISEQQQAVRGIEFVRDGAVMLLLDTDRREVLQYRLEEPYDITTAAYVDALDLSEQTRYPQGLSVVRDGESLYVTDTMQARIFRYDREAEAAQR